MFDNKAFALRLESFFAEEMALVCSCTTHLVTAVTTEVLATVSHRQKITSKITRSRSHPELPSL